MLIPLFIVFSLLIFHTYLGYPLLLLLLGGLRRKRVHKVNIRPKVSIIIPARNEAAVIHHTIMNKLECAYPAEKREILVVSDASDDGTDEIVRTIGHPDVHLIRQEPRKGKTSALNKAVMAAKGEIIVFSDANSVYREDALQHLVNNFADPEVGYVTGRMSYFSPNGSGIADSCGAYMKYENALRSLETRCGSIVGVDGGIDAVRRELYIEMSPDMLPDFVLPLLVVERGYRVVYEPKAVLAEDALSSSGGEFRMRVRVALRALRAMWHLRRIFNPFKHGLFSLQLFSHKLLRYSIPFVLICLLLLNALMMGGGGFWMLAFTGQCLFYGTAVLGYILLRFRKRLPAVVYFPFYFVLLNSASLVAWVKFLMKKKQVFWTPRTG